MRLLARLVIVASALAFFGCAALASVVLASSSARDRAAVLNLTLLD